jgi:hypothetical protein
MNLKGRPRADNLNDVYVMCIHRANLDAMGGRAVSTIEAHAAAVKKTVQNCRLMGKTPTIPTQGPMPCADKIGMGMAVGNAIQLADSEAKIKRGKAYPV